MGIAVSNWRLARTVSLTGELGVVSGTAIDSVLARRLQSGDSEGDMRRALAAFPNPAIAERILKKYFLEDGKADDQPYRPIPKLTLDQKDESTELLIVASFCEVWLAKEGHRGSVGINFLEKIQMATVPSILGAILANVDYIIMGAGLPREIPSVIKALAVGESASVKLEVKDATREYRSEITPTDFVDAALFPRTAPKFLAIISSDVLASYLSRDESSKPDGFVIEGPTAGGHNAPPRGQLKIDEDGEPIYGDRDAPNLSKIRELGLPYWLAGGYATPAAVQRAIELGAEGIQAGTIFALAQESGFAEEIRAEILTSLRQNEMKVKTDVYASPTGFPIKILQLVGTAGQNEIFDSREKLCDLGYLRTPVELADGRMAYRCSSEPEEKFLQKGGTEVEITGRKCLCNGLMANIGLGQHRITGYDEPALVTLGSDLSGAQELLKSHPAGWSAKDAVTYLLGN